jgi:RNA polymerase sigma factor (sigma-70 family)
LTNGGTIIELSTARRTKIETIYRDHEARLLRFLKLRLGSDAEAQDAAQETFVRLWKNGGQLHSENIPALLFVTARNVATDVLRKTRRVSQAGFQSAESEEGKDNVGDDQAGPDRILAAKSDLALVVRILEELPQKCRFAFISYRFEDRDYEDIAQEMGVSQSMVRKYVLKAVSYCATRFEELEGWE